MMCYKGSDLGFRIWGRPVYPQEKIHRFISRRYPVRKRTKNNQRSKARKEMSLFEFKRINIQPDPDHAIPPSKKAKTTAEASPPQKKCPHLQVKDLEPIPDNATVERLLQVSPDEAHRIANLPQDITLEDGTMEKNPEWLASRRPAGIARITGSVIGGLLGFSKYQSQDASIGEHIESTFKGNAATAWGSKHEDTACDKFQAWAEAEFDGAEVVVKHYGLLIHPENPFLAYSPDGDVQITHADGRIEKALLEIKCPYYKRYKAPSDEPIYGVHDWPNGKSGPCPVHYWFQIQLGCYIFGRKYCYFVMWIPKQTQVFRIDFDEEYFFSTTLPSVRDVFWNQYIPRLRTYRDTEIRDHRNWSSIKITDKPKILDQDYFGILETFNGGGGIVAIKDTSGSYYKNELIDATHFKYIVPKNVALADIVLQDALRPCKRYIFRLYKAKFAKDQFLSEWIVDQVAEDGKLLVVTLWRLPKQHPVHEETIETQYRSNSERRHEAVLRQLLPASFKIMHEPEASVCNDLPFVIDGKPVNWDGESYRIDYVAIEYQSGRRFVFESKADLGGFTEESKEKCRFLRESGSTVFAIIGDEPIFYDFADETANEKQMSLDDFQAWVKSTEPQRMMA